MTRYRLYYVDSKGEKRYIHRTEGEGIWETDNQDVVLKRWYAEARQGTLLEVEGAINPERKQFIQEWYDIHH